MKARGRRTTWGWGWANPGKTKETPRCGTKSSAIFFQRFTAGVRSGTRTSASASDKQSLNGRGMRENAKLTGGRMGHATASCNEMNK